jgi:hypothetical protein
MVISNSLIKMTINHYFIYSSNQLDVIASVEFLVVLPSAGSMTTSHTNVEGRAGLLRGFILD